MSGCPAPTGRHNLGEQSYRLPRKVRKNIVDTRSALPMICRLVWVETIPPGVPTGGFLASTRSRLAPRLPHMGHTIACGEIARRGGCCYLSQAYRISVLSRCCAQVSAANGRIDDLSGRARNRSARWYPRRSFSRIAPLLLPRQQRIKPIRAKSFCKIAQLAIAITNQATSVLVAQNVSHSSRTTAQAIQAGPALLPRFSGQLAKEIKRIARAIPRIGSSPFAIPRKLGARKPGDQSGRCQDARGLQRNLLISVHARLLPG